MSRARVSDIVSLAAEMAAVDRNAILGRSRHGRLVRIRQACMTVARESGHSYPAIGRRMNRDHSTIVHGVDKAGIIAERNADYAAFLARLRNAAGQAKPYVAERIPRIAPVVPEPVAPVPEPAASVSTDELDDIELLSRAVAAHYATA